MTAPAQHAPTRTRRRPANYCGRHPPGRRPRTNKFTIFSRFFFIDFGFYWLPGAAVRFWYPFGTGFARFPQFGDFWHSARFLLAFCSLSARSARVCLPDLERSFTFWGKPFRFGAKPPWGQGVGHTERRQRAKKKRNFIGHPSGRN